jgi:predicted amidohydrolase
MRVAALQFDVRRDDPTSNLAAAEAGLRAARAAGVALVCLPEMWATSFPGPGEVSASELEAARAGSARVAALATELELAVCGSGYGVAPGEARPRNRLELFLPRGDGRPALTYDKVHLFSPTAEDESFSAGSGPPPTVETPLGRVSALVCYDLRFPELTRVPFLDRAELVCVPAQWPSTRAAHFRALAVGLAVAGQCFVVAANRTGRDVVGRRALELEFPGNSLVVDPHGAVLAEGAGADGLVAAEVDLEVARRLRRRVPVERDRRPELYADWGRGT